MNSFARSEVLVRRGEPLPFSDEPVHRFVAGGYCKLYRVDGNCTIGQHRHTMPHDGVLLLGTAAVQVGDSWVEMQAPARIHIPAHKAHLIAAKTEILWACVWPDAQGATEPDDIDHQLIED